MSQLNQTPNSEAAPPSGQNGAGSAPVDPRAMLAQMVAQRDQPADPPPNDPSMPSAQDDPENPVPPAEPDQPGQDNLPPDEGGSDPNKEPDTTDGASSTGQQENSPSDSDFNQAFKSLNADARKHLLEMAKAVANGDTSLGELKRGHKLTSQIEELKQEIEKLKDAGAEPGAPDGSRSTGPATVGKLKSVQEVEARIELAEKSAWELEKFLRRNPEGGVIGEQQYTVDQIEGAIEGWRAELKALPKRAAAIQQQQQFSDQQAQVKSRVLQQFPELADPEQATAKAVRQKIAAAPFLKQFASPEYAAMIWIEGERVLNARAAARNSANGANGKPGTVAPAKPAGKVPLGKPHAAPGGSAPKVNGEVSVESALKSARTEGSRNSLARLLQATGR
jgi:hypothetical protein